MNVGYAVSWSWVLRVSVLVLRPGVLVLRVVVFNVLVLFLRPGVLVLALVLRVDVLVWCLVNVTDCMHVTKDK